MIDIICGHYGCGKTNLAINMALDSAKSGEETTLFDLDIVNPYFRSGDYGELLKSCGVSLIASDYANSNLDLPAIPPAMYSMLTRHGRVIIDLGGDDAGATALGRFSAKLSEREYRMIYVVNRYRALSQTVAEALELLRRIEASSRLTATHIVNNSHMMQLTNAQDVIDSVEFARELSEKSGRPLLFAVCERRLLTELAGRVENLYPVDIYVKKPWE